MFRFRREISDCSAERKGDLLRRYSTVGLGERSQLSCISLLEIRSEISRPAMASVFPFDLIFSFDTIAVLRFGNINYKRQAIRLRVCLRHVSFPRTFFLGSRSFSARYFFRFSRSSSHFFHSSKNKPKWVSDIDLSSISALSSKILVNQSTRSRNINSLIIRKIMR